MAIAVTKFFERPLHGGHQYNEVGWCMNTPTTSVTFVVFESPFSDLGIDNFFQREVIQNNAFVSRNNLLTTYCLCYSL